MAVTDNDWFDFLRRRPELTEVNFWQPGGVRNFRALDPGQPLLFKLHYPQNYIVGGGFFATFSILPLSLAWETFGPQNGVPNLEEMRRRIAKFRKESPDPKRDYDIGCIILEDPFYLEESAWIPAPADFAKAVVTGKGYDLTGVEGTNLWNAVVSARGLRPGRVTEPYSGEMYGEPTLFRPRLGQGGFRVVVTDTYERRCAVTGEKTLPVLQAAHIRPVSEGGTHRIDNGLLLRSDVHTLFDLGYVTITPAHQFKVSAKLREGWSNGRVYYELQDREIWVPKGNTQRPNRLELEWHSDVRFKG